MSSRDVTSAALQAARKGWPVYPIRPHTKRPYFGRIRELATTDPRTICIWWSEVYPDADLGAIPPAHIVRIDVDRHDPDKDGARRVARWRSAGFELPETLACATPKGGSHHYFRTAATGLASHPICQDGSVELKTGNVILPPSHGYEWKGYGDEPIAALPHWVIDKWNNERLRRWRISGPTPTIEDGAELADRIAIATGAEPRMRGDFGSFTCPAHEDRHASAWLRTREPVIVGCSAGCTPAAILAALGVSGVNR